ncbi:glycosyltransferase [Enterovibrio sp. Hal110]
MKFSGKVAVIMSVYKNDNFYFLKNSIESIISQDYSGIRLFIFRDGVVSDDIQSYLESMKLLGVKVINSNSNRGLANGLNTLIDEVLSTREYDYIARMDSDDISRPNRISRQVSFMESDKSVDVCGTSCREFGASFSLNEKHLPTSHSELLDFSITRCPFIHPSVMFRSSVFEGGIRYPTNTSLTEDMALWFELLNRGCKFANINEVLIDYRLDERTIQRRKGFDKAISEVKIRLYNMFKLQRFSMKALSLILARFVFHLLPDYAMRLVYKKAR